MRYVMLLLAIFGFQGCFSERPARKIADVDGGAPSGNLSADGAYISTSDALGNAADQQTDGADEARLDSGLGDDGSGSLVKAGDSRWRYAGHVGLWPDPEKVVSVTDFGATGDGETDDAPSIKQAIEETTGPCVIFFPAGTYLLRSQLKPQEGQILRGAGRTQTKIDCQLSVDNASCINIDGSTDGTVVDVVSGFDRGSTQLVVEDASRFAVGDVIALRQDNDPEAMYTHPERLWEFGYSGSGAPQRAVGQLLKITAIDGDTIGIERPLRLTYKDSLNPGINKINAIRNVGVEQLYITRNYRIQGLTIWIGRAENCWVQDIESDYTTAAHITIQTALNSEIRNSYFHHSHFYGDGGNGYGVSIGAQSTDNLVINNVFYMLRHAMIIGTGATGNVFAYNYSSGRKTDADYQGADIALHGYYPTDNLYESNIVEQIVSADYWGPSGPYNTFLRNRTVDEGILIRDYSHDQFLIGNEIIYQKTRTIEIDDSVQRTVLHGNNVDGEITGWSEEHFADHAIPNSLFLAEKPYFWGDGAWPALGGDMEIGSGAIPAEQRYNGELSAE